MVAVINVIILSLLFGCPMINFRLSLREQPHSFDVNHCIFLYFDFKVNGSLVTTLCP